MTQSILERAPVAGIIPGLVDCDIHPAMRSVADLKPFLPSRWQEHLAIYGTHLRQMYSNIMSYPRMNPDTSRRDAWPPAGGPPGSDLAFMRQQHLDPFGVTYGMLQPLRPSPPAERNLDFSAALSRAMNEWQYATWIEPEPRLRGSLVVPQEDPEAAVAEIEHWAGDRGFAQVAMAPKASEPLGRRRYWPIYEAAVRAGLPVGLHVSGTPGYAHVAAGWPSYYIEDHNSLVGSMQALTTSMIMEGVFERFPDLKLVLIEGGFGWAAPLGWRLDKAWEKFRSELPHLKRPPSEYLKQHFWFTTQPIEEPERPEQLMRSMEDVGWDRLMFSSDYPHWDYDDPRYAFPRQMTPEQREKLFRDNARALYRLD